MAKLEHLREHLRVTQGPGRLVVVFGGIGYATPAFMEEQTPERVKKACRCAFAPCWDGSEDFTLAQVIGVLRERRLQADLLGVVGFSRGGRPAFDAYETSGASLKLAGFIDPSFKEAHLQLSFGRACVFMGVSTEMQTFRLAWLYPELQAKILADGGVVLPNSKGHRTQPAAFFAHRDVLNRLGL